jgi:hypothetical protein
MEGRPGEGKRGQEDHHPPLFDLARRGSRVHFVILISSRIVWGTGGLVAEAISKERRKARCETKGRRGADRRPNKAWWLLDALAWA